MDRRRCRGAAPVGRLRDARHRRRVAAFQGFTAPIDVANDYLDAAPEGRPLEPYACQDDGVPDAAVVSSQGQNLGMVHIDGRSFASVRGTIDLADGWRTGIDLRLQRRGDDWCVSAVEVGQP